MLDVDKFWRDGFLIVPGVLEPELVKRWRRASLARENPQADLLSDPVLQEVVLDERLISFAGQILAAQPVYFGDSTANTRNDGWGFHKDNSDRLDGDAPDWKTERYPIIRFGIYTKRHDHDEPGSIDFRRGSHLVPDIDTGERVYACTQPGDLIVWNARTTHSGNSRIVRGTSYRPMPDGHSIMFRLLRGTHAERWLMKPEAEQRVALFASYAAPGPLLERHLAYLRSRAYPWEMWKASHWTGEAKALAADRGLALVDPTEFRPDPGVRLNVEYVPIPY
jgi:hypothetical protein